MARGIDRIEKTLAFYGTSPTTTVSYPVYDAHGNMIKTISRSGTNGYSHTDARVFGAWGEGRNSSGPSASKGRYVANLGHVQDDESGLVYMRARYYEPGTGRFVSEDFARDGSNWFAYAENNPVHRVDPNGKQSLAELQIRILGVLRMPRTEALAEIQAIARECGALVAEMYRQAAMYKAEGDALLIEPLTGDALTELMNLEMADLAFAKAAEMGMKAKLYGVVLASELSIVLALKMAEEPW